MALNRTRASVVAYVLLIVLLYSAKPALMFTPEGRMKMFSTRVSEETTLYTFGIACVGLAIFVFFGFSLLDLMYASE
jgi:hypothetical protein